MEPIRVYVGSDRSQQLAVRVLEHSIKRHTSAAVEVIPMIDLPVPEPKDPRQGQRTGFSYSRFCIPQLANYSGRAIYMDADMLVFQDITQLWNIPFDGAKVIIQAEVKHGDSSTDKKGAPSERIKQCSVMLLDCDRLDWDIKKIVSGFDDGSYTYEDLMFYLCILDESEVKYGVPFEWNSLEHYDSNTCLIHYTDMLTQPWVSTENSNGELWFSEVRLMLENGSLTLAELEEEIALGYFRHSLMRDIQRGPQRLLGRRLTNLLNRRQDKLSNFVMHKEVYDAKRRRKKLIKKYELALKEDNAPKVKGGDEESNA